MSIYRCSICEQYKDADRHGCNEHPNEAFDNICDNCQELACFMCGEIDLDVKYCKITDQYYHDKCV